MKKSIISFVLLLIIFIGITVFVMMDVPKTYGSEETATIHLYGETHGLKEYYDIEFETWKSYYDNEGMRVLFVELPYYTAEFLNIWMKEENDDIINQFYEDIEGTASHTMDYINFFKRIKEECPETVFYGTDVGHQYNITGARYLSYLEEHDMADSEQYQLTLENIEQGKEWSQRQDPVDWGWREEKMISNFIHAYERAGSGEIMGIYGTLHINLEDTSIMAGALKEHYGDVICCTYLYSLLFSETSYQFGFSYIGLIFLLMLFIPNMIWAKHQPKDYDIYVKNESKVLLVFERIGQALTTVVAVIFTDFNIHIFISQNGVIVPARIGYLIFAFVLMICYELYWIRYFKSEKTMGDFYSSFLGVPLAGATLPVMAFGLLGIYGGNLIMVISVIILGIGHIGIHWAHYNHCKNA